MTVRAPLTEAERLLLEHRLWVQAANRAANRHHRDSDNAVDGSVRCVCGARWADSGGVFTCPNHTLNPRLNPTLNGSPEL